MHPVSDRFLKTATGSARPVTRAFFSHFGQPGRLSVPVYSGTVKVSTKANVTRNLEEMRVGIEDLLPLTSESALSIYGTQVQVYKGFRYVDGAEELAPVGTFLVEEIDDESAPIRQVSIKGRDLSAIISYNRWEDMYPMAGVNVHTGIRNAIENRAPGRFKFNLMTNNQVIQSWTLGEEVENDPWADLVSLATAYGMILSVDPLGNIVLRDKPEESTPRSPVFTFTQNANLVSYHHSQSSDQLYNRVVVTGEPPEGDPVRAAAEDSDRESPTYVGGAFGVRQRFYNSNLITSQFQALKTARAMLLEALESEHKLLWSGFVNPALQEYDVVRVDADVAPELPSSLFELSEFTIPLDETISTDYEGTSLRSS